MIPASTDQNRTNPGAASDRLVVVTGAGSGLGRAVAESALAEGWRVALIDRDRDALDAAESALGAAAFTADVTDPTALADTFTRIATAGPIHGLVNCAGLTRSGPSETLPSSDWNLVVDVDLSGSFYVCQAAYPHLSPDASIVNIASIASVRGLPQRTAYSAAKAGVVGMTRALAAEWASSGIRVNAVGPSWVDTPLVRGLIDAGTVDGRELAERVPLRRLCTGEDVAQSVLFLLSPARSGFVTGQTLYVDGGFVWAE